jgi:hypothetical protein
VVVTDNIGCTTSLSGVAVAARTPTTITLVPTPATCNGYKNGYIIATVSGNPTYTYSWSNGATTKNISGLSAGLYTLTATDVNGCSTSESTTINQPFAINLSLIKVDDTNPTAAGNGSIDLTAVGGTPLFTYAWSRAGGGFSATSELISNLTAGVYTVIVTDANGCTATASAIIYEPEICNDGIDNDGDGLIDCADGQCLPTNPGTITPGSASVCVGATGVTYSVPNTAGYTYTWSVPAGATITAGQGTNQITVNWVANIGGQICVTDSNTVGCVSASASCYTVVLSDKPAQPGTIVKGN